MDIAKKWLERILVLVRNPIKTVGRDSFLSPKTPKNTSFRGHPAPRGNTEAVRTLVNGELISDCSESTAGIAVVQSTVSELNVSYDQTLDKIVGDVD